MVCIKAAGKNKKGLNFDLFCSSSSVSDPDFFRIFPKQKMNIQMNSPSACPQHWRNGWLKGLVVPFFPSDS